MHDVELAGRVLGVGGVLDSLYDPSAAGAIHSGTNVDRAHRGRRTGVLGALRCHCHLAGIPERVEASSLVRGVGHPWHVGAVPRVAHVAAHRIPRGCCWIVYDVVLQICGAAA